MAQFVLLRHTFDPSDPRPDHWDLMFEAEGALKTWSSPTLPRRWLEQLAAADAPDESRRRGDAVAGDATIDAGTTCECQLLPDHRRAYLDYEGPVSQNRGTVRRCDRGTVQWLRHDTECVAVEVSGNIIRGTILLRRVDGSEWELRILDGNG